MRIDKLKIDNEIRRIVAVKSRDSLRRRITSGKIKHPDGKQKESGKWLLKSSHLNRGISYKMQGAKIKIGVTGPARTYARILHEGGVIKPRKAKFLAIPLTPAARVKKPRDWDDTFIQNGLICRKEGKKVVALYKLQKSVTIPAFDYMTIQSDDMKVIVKVVKDYLTRKYN